MTELLSMSMRVDKPSEINVTIPARTPTTWIPDCRVHHCFQCNLEFSWTRRKHHCRSCGRIFCYSCSSYIAIPPTYIQLPQKPLKMCSNCAKTSRESKKSEWLVLSLAIMPVTISELFILRTLDKTWNFSVNVLLSFFRGIQYKLPCQVYSQLEKDFLWTHFKEFDKHVQWQIHTIISAKDRPNFLKKCKFPNFLPHKTCKLMLCSRTCTTNIKMSDIIRLAITNTLYINPIQQWVIKTWHYFHPNIHLHFMPWWVFIACKYPILFVHGLIPLVSKHIPMTYALWFECEIQKTQKNIILLTDVQQKICHNEQIKQDIHKSKALVELFKTIAKSPNEYTVQTFFETYGQTRLPWAPLYILQNIVEFKQLHSASSPVVCYCQLLGNQTIKILLKNEDVRIDKLAMAISYWIMQKTKNISIPVYNVFPLQKNVGLVEMIPMANTIYDIRKKSTILNHIMNHNPDTTTKTLRERMISSSAGACLLAFTMGLGDRHLENILVTQHGYLVHVDFGYVLGDDPKHVATPMRITEDMVDALGGKNSRTFELFVQRTQEGYELMRLHADLWYHLLCTPFYVFNDVQKSPKRIKDHILDRFVPGEWSSEASLHIQTVVQQASETSYLQNLLDMSHTASNQLSDLFRMRNFFK